MQNGWAITWGNMGTAQSVLSMFIKIYLVLTTAHQQTANDKQHFFAASGWEGCDVDVAPNIMNTEWSRNFQNIKLLNGAILAVINNRLEIYGESQDAHWFSEIEGSKKEWGEGDDWQ